VCIVPGALLGVGEDFVGRLDFGEEGGCAFDVAVVAVGVEFEGFLAVGFLDSMFCMLVLRTDMRIREVVLLVGCVPLYSQEHIVTRPDCCTVGRGRPRVC
jgi:hypothetical protein